VQHKLSIMRDRDTSTASFRRLLRENGVTYSVHGAPGGEHRAWQLDAVPWIVSEQDWKTIEAGLIQRAELLDHILTDLHGDQRLITGGWLPPELIHAHRGYLRPCHGMKLASMRQLVLYAADLARGPDGRMWIVNDRTQAPSGSGYVVENRGVMTRAMPRLFHRTGIRRIAGFFRRRRRSIACRRCCRVRSHPRRPCYRARRTGRPVAARAGARVVPDGGTRRKRIRGRHGSGRRGAAGDRAPHGEDGREGRQNGRTNE
jgi:uncharacterized circularly permuted ATP-grasp superfamily protein